MHDRMQEKQNQSAGPQPARPGNEQTPSKGKVGEYIEFEEVK